LFKQVHNNVLRDDRGIITMCSYCGDLKDNQENWQAIEAEITKVDLFQQSPLPQISHGICPTCKTDFLKKYAKLFSHLECPHLTTTAANEPSR